VKVVYIVFSCDAVGAAPASIAAPVAAETAVNSRRVSVSRVMGNFFHLGLSSPFPILVDVMHSRCTPPSA
jgi:hypothetical protein